MTPGWTSRLSPEKDQADVLGLDSWKKKVILLTAVIQPEWADGDLASGLSLPHTGYIPYRPGHRLGSAGRVWTCLKGFLCCAIGALQSHTTEQCTWELPSPIVYDISKTHLLEGLKKK